MKLTSVHRNFKNNMPSISKPIGPVNVAQTTAPEGPALLATTSGYPAALQETMMLRRCRRRIWKKR